MEPIRFADAPSLELGVENGLRRLDKNLVLTWSPYALDPNTGRPIELSGRLDPDPSVDAALCGRGALVHDPAWYLWRRDANSTHHFFIRTYARFSYPELRAIESDLARFHSPDEILRLLKDRYNERQARGLAAKRQLQMDKIRANRSRIRDLLDGKLSRRAPRVASYRGQSHRTSSAERREIEMDPREAGWELPEPTQF